MAAPLILTFYTSGVRRRHRWRLVHRNGNKMCQTSQGGGFSNRIDCEHNAAVSLGSPTATFAIDSADGQVHLTGRPDIEVIPG